MLLPFYLLLLCCLRLAIEASPVLQSDTEVATQTKPRNSANYGSADLPESGQKNIVCYYNFLSAGREGKGRLTPDKVDPFMCTHLIYCSVEINKDGKVQSLDPSLDFEENGGQGGLRKFTNLKLANPKLKVLLSIDDASPEFSKMAGSEETRNVFIRSAIDFVTRFNFDGIDIAWKYPGDFEGRPSDKRNYIILLRSLKLALKSRGHLLSAIVTKDKDHMERGYDIPNAVNYLDLINLMTYDYNGNWDNYTGLHAPLYSSSKYARNEDDSMLNVNWSVNHWISQGAPREKLNLGISTWGRTYSLVNPKVNDVWAPANGPGPKGAYTKDDALQGYMEICAAFKKPQFGGSARWTKVYVPEYEQPYAYRGRDWVSYEDAKSVAMKTEYAKKIGLGGVAIVSVDTDDFNEQCDDGRFPLVQAAARELNKDKLRQEATSETGRVRTTDKPKNESCRVQLSNATPGGATNNKKHIICYYNSMSAKRTGHGKLTVPELDPFLCTHIVYSFLAISAKDFKIIHRQKPNDRDRDMVKQLVFLRENNNNLKIFVALGGQNEESAKYSEMVATPERRAAFIQSVVEFLEKYVLDGVAIDWEWPGSDDRDNYVLLLGELRKTFDERKMNGGREWQLMVTVPGLRDFIDNGYDVEQMVPNVDIVNLRDSSYTEAGMTKTKIHAPIRHPKHHQTSSASLRRNAKWSIEYWIEKGMPRKKLTLGLGTYGDSYTLINAKQTRINADSSTGPPGRYTKLDGFWGYNEICEARKDDPAGWQLFKYPDCKCPYTVKGDTWIAYDDDESLKKKGDFVKEMQLGGVMIYSLDTDDFRGICHDDKYPLVRAIKETMNQGPAALLTNLEDCDVDTTTTSASSQTTVAPETTKRAEPTKSQSSNTLNSKFVTWPKADDLPKDSDSFQKDSPVKPTSCGEDGRWWFPGPTCRQYYECWSRGTPKLMSCADGLAWKQKLLSCDHPNNEPRVNCKV